MQTLQRQYTIGSDTPDNGVNYHRGPGLLCFRGAPVILLATINSRWLEVLEPCDMIYHGIQHRDGGGCSFVGLARYGPKVRDIVLLGKTRPLGRAQFENLKHISLRLEVLREATRPAVESSHPRD